MRQHPEEVTIRSVGEFAKHLGLSRWTVSRVINGHTGVHEETRRRVLSEMERLHFQPNLMARGLRGTKTGLVGVCLQEIESPILVRKISALQATLREHGLRGVIEIVSGHPNSEQSIINHFLSLQVDGIILIGSALKQDDPIFSKVKADKTSVVAVDPAYNVPFPRVELDRQLAMFLCLRHLQQVGRTSFALLGLESDPIYGFRRIEGLKKAASRLEIPWDECFTSIKIETESDWSYHYGCQMSQELMQMESPPRGVIALNDRVAIGAIQSIKEWGYSVPKDFSVVGFDNLDVCEWIEPGLTTIAQNVKEMSKEAINLLINQTDNQDENFPVVHVQPRLIVRGST